MPTPPDELIRDRSLNYIQELRARAAEADEVRRLRQEIEKKKLEQELASLSLPTQPTKPRRRPLDFYEQQITAWFNRLPPEARKAPRSMEEFINLLEGRTPGMRAHAPDVSRTLIRLGWHKCRIWSANSQSRRVWRPSGL
jgi:hypothetical protein